MITRNSKHMKATPIIAEQYLWDQLGKHTKIDPLEYLLKQYENHAQHTKLNAYNEQLDNSSNKNIRQNMQQESTQHINKSAQNQTNPKDNINNRTTQRERKDNNDNYTRILYGRLIHIISPEYWNKATKSIS